MTTTTSAPAIGRGCPYCETALTGTTVALEGHLTLTLEASTGHLPPAERDWLQRQADQTLDLSEPPPLVLAVPTGWGWHITVPFPEAPDWLAELTLAAPRLAAVVGFCQRLRIGRLLLDADAPALAGFPTFPDHERT